MPNKTRMPSTYYTNRGHILSGFMFVHNLFTDFRHIEKTPILGNINCAPSVVAVAFYKEQALETDCFKGLFQKERTKLPRYGRRR